MGVLIAACILAVGFIIMAIVNGSKMSSAPKKEKSAVKQKVFLYSFATAFSIGIAIFAYFNL